MSVCGASRRVEIEETCRYITYSKSCSQYRSCPVNNRPTMRCQLLPLLLAIAVICPRAWGARILAIFPTPSISHQLPYQTVMKALAARGHQVTVISTDPLKEPMANYTDIDLSFIYNDVREAIFADVADMDPLTTSETLAPFFFDIMEKQLASKPIQDFLRYNASQGYDMVIAEWIFYDSFLGIYHAVGSPPLVGIVSLSGTIVQYYSIGNPHNPAINPEAYSDYTDHMTFWQRLHNTYLNLRYSRIMETTFFPRSEQMYRKYFGHELPPSRETRRNMSLLLLCNHWSLEYPRALLPNVVQLTGLQVQNRPPPLPAELKAWLDGAGAAGVVYFSLGSNVMSKDLPPATMDALLRAFARLPQRVLWKFEEEGALPNRPENVRVAKWLPQQSILAHPNVRLFITQGGLQSFQEAAYHAVPLIGMPFLWDQYFNAAKIVAAGIGKRIFPKEITEESVYNTITEIVNDPGYAERMRRLSAVYREHKERSLDDALWWVEYVLRHDGAPHLRTAALDLQWYQLLLLDVAAFVLGAALLLALTLYFAARTLFRIAFPSNASLQKKKKEQ